MEEERYEQDNNSLNMFAKIWYLEISLMYRAVCRLDHVYL